MYLGLIETRYDYRLSYLDQWAHAWRQIAHKTEHFNLVRNQDLKRLQSRSREFDLLVVLHSVSSDSNTWLRKLASAQADSRAPMIMFIGNEFSSPFLSTELRLELIAQISPEIIASQLTLDSAKWLYEKTNSHVVSAPPGMPVVNHEIVRAQRPIDLGYRGYKYPWYLLDQDRNDIVELLADFFKSQNKNVDISYSHRFASSSWFRFLQNSKFTVSSEAGSSFVFRDDEVWRDVLEFFKKKHKFSAINNDAIGMNLFRLLPAPFKNFAKLISTRLGINQASLYAPDPQERETLMSLVDPMKFESRNGKAISSRHFDAIACGTWQILLPGEYNGILSPDLHYTSSVYVGDQGVRELMENSKSLQIKTQNAIESLAEHHTYRARVNSLIREVG